MMVADKVMKYWKQQCDGSGSNNENIRNSNVMVADQARRISGTAL